MYALVASTTGVSLLALTPPSNAQIVYTPANIPIATNTTVMLDVNKDGINDFIFSNVFKGYDSLNWDELKIFPGRKGSRIWMLGNTSNFWGFTPAFQAGHWIGEDLNFRSQAGYMGFGYKITCFKSGSGCAYNPNPGSCAWPWTNVANRYLALKFSIHGQVHFGWARLTEACDTKTAAITATVTGYAYETTVKKPIRAGQKTESPDSYDDEGLNEEPNQLEGPGNRQPTLGMLALGSLGLSNWRTAPEESTVPPAH